MRADRLEQGAGVGFFSLVLPGPALVTLLDEGQPRWGFFLVVVFVHLPAAHHAHPPKLLILICFVVLEPPFFGHASSKTGRFTFFSSDNPIWFWRGIQSSHSHPPYKPQPLPPLLFLFALQID